MSSDEDDYMSSTFLVEPSNDIRPGLIKNRTTQREIDNMKKKQMIDEQNKLKNRPLKRIESEQRDVGLQQPISSDNKGFALLQKMGFKEGSGLGKEGSGRKEPVPIEVKTDRQGLGRMSDIKEVLEMKAAIMKETQKSAMSTSDYRAMQTKKSAEKRDWIDLMKCQRVCNQFDTEVGKDTPVEDWYWPRHTIKPPEPTEEVDDENEDVDPDTIAYKLQMVNLYLREHYFYCIWCGIKFEDAKDLLQECPGCTRDDH